MADPARDEHPVDPPPDDDDSADHVRKVAIGVITDYQRNLTDAERTIHRNEITIARFEADNRHLRAEKAARDAVLAKWLPLKVAAADAVVPYWKAQEWAAAGWFVSYKLGGRVIADLTSLIACRIRLTGR